ncbi:MULTISPECIES: alginate lyase family protein [unclassified Minwuia]|jgi:Heparinase II/III-like protein/Heparinase II/III N-terminus|uniref:alginate lyase family protein n=1 Tax=unclassified Minwuia TaxID=2618799 RepID=UPI00247A5C4F|nr:MULTISPECIES: alginate lyase family protein [unclassified Minwuia]
MATGHGSSENLVRLVRKARWYRNRLAAMSAAEIAHRMEEQARRRISRIYLPGSVTGFNGAGFDLPVWPGLADGVGRIAGDAGLLSGWAENARLVRAGELSFLGIDWPKPDGAAADALPDWHLDPATGQRWPDDRYCFDISYRHADEFGDVKNVWELSRLQYLQPVAAYALVSEDAAAVAVCEEHLTSWVAANPVYRGVHWSSGIEVAFRIVSMLVILSLVGSQFRAEARATLMRSLYQHGWWLARFPSRHSSANNHLVAEAGGLFMLGALCPGLPGARRWADYGRAVLERECQRQIHADGVGAEQSPAYAALTVEWLLLSGDLGRRLGQGFSPDFWARIARAGGFLKWMTDSAGHQPRIGDDDDSHVFGNGMGVEPTINSVMAAVAQATDRPEISPPVPVRHLRHALMPAPPPNGIWPGGFRHFSEGGYSVQRHLGKGAADHLLVFDHGPIGYLSIAAHGHADTLSVWLHVEGQPVLIDAGTYLYHAGHAWRDHFRGTVAHNTLTLGGENSSEISGPFNWARKAETRVLRVNDSPDDWLVSAEHDGYQASHGIAHVRTVERAGPGLYRITDTLRGHAAPQRVEIGFLVSPTFEVEAAGTGFRIRDERGVVLTIRHAGGLAGWLETGRSGPERGWHSPSFGVRAPAPRIVFAGELTVGREAVFDLEIHEVGQ